MSSKKTQAFRGVRKTAHISHKIFANAAQLSDRIEKKANRIILGTDPTIRIHDKLLFEEVFEQGLPEITPIHPALPHAGRKPTVTLLIPSLQKSSFYGGTATALLLAAKLANAKGFSLRIVEPLLHGRVSKDEVTEFFMNAGINYKDNGIELVDLSARRFNHYGYLDIHPQDLFLATAWWDAYLLDRLPLKKPYVYLLQDFEPIFYNNSDKYVFAENTYRSRRFLPVCNTKLMYDFMSGQGYTHIEQKGLWFEPAVGLQEVTPRAKSGKRRMFLYGRPSVARNLYYLALSCLDDLFAEQKLSASDWDVYMAGQDNLADIILSSGVVIKNLGKMSMEDYHDFIRTVDLAISPMMAPHPNYPTLEFASAGAAVVTTKWREKTDLSRYSKNILLADTTKADLKEKILAASHTTPEQRQKNQSQVSTDWDQVLDPLVSEITKKIDTMNMGEPNL